MKKFRVFLMICLVFFMTAIFGKTDALAATVSLSANGNWVDGDLTVKGGRDYYKVTLSQPGTLDITYQGLDIGYSYVAITSEDIEETYRQSSLLNNTSAANPKTTVVSADLQAGTYTVVVWGHASSYTGTYRLKATFTAAGSQDTEPNDSFSQAMRISGQTTIRGFLAQNEEYDFFAFTLPADRTVTIRYANEVDGVISIYDSSYIVLKSSRPVNGTFTFSQSLERGTYYIRISRYYYSTGMYTLSFATGSSTGTGSHTHSWGSGKVTTAATCTKSGVRTYTCSTCGTKKTEAIAKTAHRYKTITTKATTRKNGSIVKKCSQCGYVAKNTTIYYAKTLKLSVTSYTYNGKVRKPSVAVYDAKGNKISSSYYAATYAKGRKNVGTYKVTVKLKGNYTGTLSKTFQIIPRATNLSSVKAASKGFTVKWKKQTGQITGCQIQYSTSSKMKSAKTIRVIGASKTSYTKKGLIAKKNYYIRIRTYRTVSGKNYYSNWSAIKRVKTK